MGREGMRAQYANAFVMRFDGAGPRGEFIEFFPARPQPSVEVV